jgi:hypothetical protein
MVGFVGFDPQIGRGVLRNCHGCVVWVYLVDRGGGVASMLVGVVCRRMFFVCLVGTLVGGRDVHDLWGGGSP